MKNYKQLYIYSQTLLSQTWQDLEKLQDIKGFKIKRHINGYCIHLNLNWESLQFFLNFMIIKMLIVLFQLLYIFAIFSSYQFFFFYKWIFLNYEKIKHIAHLHNRRLYWVQKISLNCDLGINYMPAKNYLLNQ